jgi:hypothetical protein
LGLPSWAFITELTWPSMSSSVRLMQGSNILRIWALRSRNLCVLVVLQDPRDRYVASILDLRIKCEDIVVNVQALILRNTTV